MIKYWIGIIPLIAAIMWGCYPAKSQHNKEKTTSLTIMTYNIHHANPPSKPGEIDIKSIAEVIRKENPDLVALQEVDVFTRRSGKDLHEAQALAEILDMHFYFAKALDYQGGFYGNAVLSKFPVLDSMRIELPTLPDVRAEDRVWAGIRVAAGEHDLWFGSTHLDFTNEKNNLHQSNKLIEALRQIDKPIIIGGDFNVTESSKSIALFDKHFLRTCPEDGPPTIPVKNPTKSIDFLMYKPKDVFKTIRHHVVDEQYASDHLPVTAEILFDPGQ